MRKGLKASRRRGFGWVWFALGVQERYTELNGNYLASAVTLSAFLSLFPLLLVATSSSDSSPRRPRPRPPSSRTSACPARPPTVNAVHHAAQHSRQAASVIGLVGLLWSGLGLVAAIQYALNAAWQVKGRGMRDKLGPALAGRRPSLPRHLRARRGPQLPARLPAPLGILLGLALDLGLWLWTMKVLLHRDVGWRALLPGAVLGAVGLDS